MIDGPSLPYMSLESTLGPLRGTCLSILHGQKKNTPAKRTGVRHGSEGLFVEKRTEQEDD